MLGGNYQLVAGERRWRASRMAGLKEVPVMIRDLSDEEVMQFALIENLQREDLTALEEAIGYKSLIDEYKLTQEEVAKTVGKSRPTITNALRLLQLPEKVQKFVNNGTVSAGHARALLPLNSEKAIIDMACLIEKEDLSVRVVEQMVKKACEIKEEKQKPKQKNSYFKEVELSLHDYLNRKIKVSGTDKKGTIQIEFYGENDLNDLISLLNLDK